MAAFETPCIHSSMLPTDIWSPNIKTDFEHKSEIEVYLKTVRRETVIHSNLNSFPQRSRSKMVYRSEHIDW